MYMYIWSIQEAIAEQVCFGFCVTGTTTLLRKSTVMKNKSHLIIEYNFNQTLLILHLFLPMESLLIFFSKFFILRLILIIF